MFHHDAVMNAHRAEREGPYYFEVVKLVEVELVHHGKGQPEKRVGEEAKEEAEHEHLLAGDSFGQGCFCD